MTFNFQVNHDEAIDMSLIEEGEYEVIVAKAFEDATPNGAVFINLHLQVRNDIDQKYKNRYIFASIWQSKQTGQYHPGMLNTIAKALRIENGKTYNSLEELLNDFIHRTARVKVVHEEYNGKTYERVKSWEPSRFDVCNHVFKTSDIPAGFVEVEDGNIPF